MNEEVSHPDGEGDEDVGDNDGDNEDEEQVEQVRRVGCWPPTKQWPWPNIIV